MYDIIIIGAGPSGMTAALYALRANKKVLVLEAFTYGGQIINTLNIENYPALPHISGVDFATNLYNQIIDMGCEFKFEKVVDIKDHTVITNENKYDGRAIIIATGATNKKLGLENEDKFIGRGISYCATCDGNFYKGKVVAVNGGGNTAIEDAIYLSNICSKVYLIHRRDEFRASEVTVNELKGKENVEFVLNSQITSLVGNDKLEKIIINNDCELNVDGLFIAIGQVPETNNFTNILNLDDGGYVISNDMKTDIPGLYVCGDVRSKSLRQLTTAISDGAIAATAAINDINNKII
jgi:thioredoxin reductase (NADPH)